MNQSHNAPVPRRGFTIVELLVVISIITLLVALMLPTLANVREQFRIAACGSNLRQMGIASNGYFNDDGMHLGIITFNPNGSLRYHNDELLPLSDYISEVDLTVFTCPSTTRYIDDIAKLSEQSPRGTEGEGKSYESYGAYWNRTDLLKTMILISGRESETWLVFDIDNTGTNWEMTGVDNHGAMGGNALHADGHVEFVQGHEWGARRWHAQRTIYPLP